MLDEGKRERKATPYKQTLEREVIRAALIWREDWLMNGHQLRDAVDKYKRYLSQKRTGKPHEE